VLRKVVPPAEVSTKGHGESTDEEPGEGDGDDTRDVQAARLTVKLRGRVTGPATRRGRTLSPRARGARPQTFHGPLERLLGVDSGTTIPRWLKACEIRECTCR